MPREARSGAVYDAMQQAVLDTMCCAVILCVLIHQVTPFFAAIVVIMKLWERRNVEAAKILRRIF